jgi:DNA-directed RNA polymerase subunit N (RpoN/RPB10)
MTNFLLQKNGISSLKKHVDANHIVVVKRFEEMNNSLKQTEEKTNIFGRSNLKKNCCERLFPKGGCATKRIISRPWCFDC